MPDMRLHDAQQAEEIELYGAVVIAASTHEGPLSVDEVDEALGLRPTSR